MSEALGFMQGLRQNLLGWLGRGGAREAGAAPQGLPVNLGGYEFAKNNPGAAARLHGVDQALIWVVVALLMWGMVMVYSASIAIPDNPRQLRLTPTYYLSRHVISLVLGAAVALLAFQVPMETWEKVARPLFVVSLVLLAAMGWAMGNQAGREAGQINMLAYVVWASLFAIPPLFILAFAMEGADAIFTSLAKAGPGPWAAVVWQSVGNTMFGYAVWGWLLSRHPSAQVAPLALLVPVFGMISSTLVLGEPMQTWKITAALLVMGGLVLSILWPRVAERLGRN